MDGYSKRDKAFKLIDALEGTCEGLHSMAEQLGIDDVDDTEITNIIDDHIFECSCCGWWSPISEMSDYEDWICYDCE